jgi:hypothetical protein
VLATNGQAFSVTNAPIAAYISQTGNILGHLSAKLTAYNVITVDNLSYPAEFVFAELAGLCVFFDSSLLQDLPRSISAYTWNVGQRNPYRFFIGNVNTNYSRHISSFVLNIKMQSAKLRKCPRFAGTKSLPQSGNSTILIRQTYDGLIFELCFLIFSTNPGAVCVVGLCKSLAQRLCDERSYNSHIYVLQNFLLSFFLA